VKAAETLEKAVESGDLTGSSHNISHDLLQAAFEIAGASYSVTRFLVLCKNLLHSRRIIR
jgi:hypothetical protein